MHKLLVPECQRLADMGERGEDGLVEQLVTQSSVRSSGGNSKIISATRGIAATPDTHFAAGRR
jgi:hypothetical protein